MRHASRVPSVVVILWWSSWLLCAFLHHHAIAEFASNPLPLNTTNVLLLNGNVTGDASGFSVAGVGDMNGDGVDDFVVGAYLAGPAGVAQAGQVYLVFGRNSSTPWTPSAFELSTLDGKNGVTINGVVTGDRLGWRVAGVQDVSGDGINDMLLGTDEGDAAYLIFGMNGTWPAAVVNLAQNAFNGVRIIGRRGDRTGDSVSAAGDVNNDGIADLAIGVRRADTPGGLEAGRMDVLYGRSAGAPWPSVVALATFVNASTGFSVLGENTDGLCGDSVAGVGDVNGDGVDDVAVGCAFSNANAVNQTGIVAVVFGSDSGLPASITPSQLNGTNGFVVLGRRSGDGIGNTVDPVGDVNADGLDDFAIGAFRADANALSDSGEMHVLFGRVSAVAPWPAQVNVSSLDGNVGFTLAGSLAGDRLGQSVSPVGDVNADGIDDLLVGADQAGTPGPGVAFLLYGRHGWPARLNSTGLDSSSSVTFQGDADGSMCGFSVSRVGDVNGDGRGDMAIGCFLADPGGRLDAGQTAVVFGPLFTPAPTTAPTTEPTMAASTTSSPTATAPTPTPVTTSPTASTCAMQGAFIPPGATCVNGVLVTTANTTAPAGTTVTVTTSVTITGGASFEQPSGSTLVFVADSSGSTSIAVQDGGCATIGGDAVVNFESDPSNGGEAGNTGTLVLVTADCVMGSFGTVTATTSFEGDACVAIDDGEQQSGGSSVSVSFGVTNTCKKSGGLSTWLLVGIIGGAIVVVAVVIGVAVVIHRKQVRKRNADMGVELR